MSFEIYRDNNFVVTEMTETGAQDIFKWVYPAPYSMYNFDGDEEELMQVLNGLHFPVYKASIKSKLQLEDRDILAKPYGFVAWGPAARLHFFGDFLYYGGNYIDVAVGIRPDECGKGNGRDFVKVACNFVKNDWPGVKLRLTVEIENLRAIKVYEAIGFKKITKIKHKGKSYLIMAEK